MLFLIVQAGCWLTTQVLLISIVARLRRHAHVAKLRFTVWNNLMTGQLVQSGVWHALLSAIPLWHVFSWMFTAGTVEDPENEVQIRGA
jgi:hypothetical protein